MPHAWDNRSHKERMEWDRWKRPLICTGCGAKWHIKPGKWARLVKTSFDGRGKEFLREKYNLEFWQKMAYEGRKVEKAIEKAPSRQPYH